MKLATLVLFLVTQFAAAAVNAEFEAGYDTEQLYDETRDRPIALDWWYPTVGQSAESMNYGLGRGLVVPRGSIAEGRFPLVVLSHGAMGAARDYSWVAEALARAGFLVAGVSHYEESYVYGSETVDPSAVLRAWQRPLDVSAAISFISSQSRFTDSADADRIAFLGHSSGGATGVGLLGLRFDTQSMAEYCVSDRAEKDRGCRYAEGSVAPLDPELVEADYQDLRIQAFVLFDPALGPAFQDFSDLKGTGPILLVGPVENDFFPATEYLEHYAANLPNTQVHRLSGGEGHFIFLDQCELDQKANGVPLCIDRPAVDRGELHDQLAPVVVSFLRTSLTPSDSR